MLLNCDSHSGEQMVAGSSAKSCHQRQNCSPNNNLDLASQDARNSCHNSPQQNDQNGDSECQLITQNQHNTKGAKRCNDSVEGLASVVLNSVSANVTHQQQLQQHQNNYQKCDGGSASIAAQASSVVVPTARCTGDKCSAYSSPQPQELVQVSHMETGGLRVTESMGNDGGDEGCESCCDVEDYDYKSILTKILNEKKLIPSTKDSGAKTERQTQQ